MTKRITLVDGRDAERVNALRLAEYAGAPGFEVKPPGILWNRSDDQATILAAWDGDELVSTLRLEPIEDRALVEAKLECPWDFAEPLAPPVLVLSKMATRRPYRKTGLNAVLRLMALELAREWGIVQVLGTLVAGSPRRVAMEEMGYRFFEHPVGWNSTHYRSTDPVLVCALDLAREGERAIAHCRALAGADLAAYPWEGPRPTRRLVSVVS